MIEGLDFAHEFAARAHAGQTRKGGTIPYIVHPERTSQTLAVLYPRVPDLAIAGLLHDVVEDTKVTIEAIDAIFGRPIGDLVWGVTRRQGWKLEPVRNIWRLKGADLLDNMTDTNRDIEAGQYVWTRFSRGIDKVASWLDLANEIAVKLESGNDHGPTTGDRTLAERVANTAHRLDELAKTHPEIEKVRGHIPENRLPLAAE